MEKEKIARRYLKPHEVAELTGIAVGTLNNDRFKSRGLPYVKIKGGGVFYDVQDIHAYMENNKIRHEG